MMNSLTHLKSVVPISLPNIQKKNIHYSLVTQKEFSFIKHFKHLHQILVVSDQFIPGINYDIKNFGLIHQRIFSHYFYVEQSCIIKHLFSILVF